MFNSIASFFQNTIGSISFASIDHRWLIIGFVLLAVTMVVYTQEKSKAITILLVVYGLWLGATYVPGSMAWLEKALSRKDLVVVRLIFQLLPIAALIILRKKHVPRIHR